MPEAGMEMERYAPPPPITNDELDLLWRIANANAKSKRFPDALYPEQAMAKILMGRDLGLSPMQSMVGIHIVEGKPEVAAVTLASFVRRLPDVRYQIVEHTNDVCEGHFFGAGNPDEEDIGRKRHAKGCPGDEGCYCNPSKQRPGEEFLGRSRFDEEDMKLAELGGKTSKGKASNHMKYPRNMKFSRMMSNGVRWFCPEATHGISVYHDGEIEPSRSDRAALPAPADPATELADIASSLPVEHRDRFWAVWGDAQRLRDGQVTVAAAQMSLSGQSPEKVVAWLERVERDNDAARKVRDASAPVDADVVEDGPGSDTETDTDAPDTHITYDRDDDLTQDERIASLNVRLSDLYDRRDSTEGALHSDEDEALRDEIEMVEGMIRDAGGELP